MKPSARDVDSAVRKIGGDTEEVDFLIIVGHFVDFQSGKG